MTDDEKFLARWSRRKRTSALDAEERVKREKDNGAIASEAPSNSVSTDEIKSAFDPQSLPPIESIGPGSDIRAFLGAGVPVDLARAAFRRLWSSDPKIRDFVGLSENSWDFNAPGAMAGFGPMEKEQVRRALTQLLGHPDIEAVAAPSTNVPRQVAGEAEMGSSKSDPVEEIKAPQESAGSTALARRMGDIAIATDDVTPATSVGSQHASALPQRRPARRRGSALPE